MYYRDGGGLGCLLGIFVMLILLSVVLAIILNPFFWIVVGVLVLFQAIARRVRGNGTGNEEFHHNQHYSREESEMRAVSGELEDDYTTGAVDVEVEVIRDDE